MGHIHGLITPYSPRSSTLEATHLSLWLSNLRRPTTMHITFITSKGANSNPQSHVWPRANSCSHLTWVPVYMYIPTGCTIELHYQLDMTSLLYRKSYIQSVQLFCGIETHVFNTWWRHQMETITASFALCEGISPESPHKGHWRGALVFSLIRAWTNNWVNNRDASDLRRYRAHDDVTVMHEIQRELSRDERY